MQYPFKGRVRWIIVAFAAVAFLSACHTIHGVGKDLESAGKAVQRGADRH